MSRNLYYYSQSNHSVVVGSHIVTDFAEGDAISFEDITLDKVAVMEGLDGARTSFSASKAGKITVKLKPTSPSIDYLNYLIERQINGAPRLQEVSITTGVNEVIKLTNAGVQRAAGTTGGPTMTEREFSFVGEQIKHSS